MYSTLLNSFKVFEKKGCTLHSALLDDERVICRSCLHASKVEVCEFVSLKKAKQLKDAGQRVGMVGDKQEVVRGWLKLSWQEWQCQASGTLTMPLDLKHRCQLYSSAKTETVSVESDWWVT